MLTPFNAEALKLRAEKRARAPIAGAGTKLWEDHHAIAELQRLVEWGVRKSITFVMTSSAAAWDVSTRTIYIPNRCRPQKQLFLTLHECGHSLVQPHDYDGRFSKGYDAIEPGVKRSLIHRIDILDEELMAWSLGFDLARELEIVIDVPRFNQLKAQSIKSYIKWALKLENYSLYDEDIDDGKL